VNDVITGLEAVVVVGVLVVEVEVEVLDVLVEVLEVEVDEAGFPLSSPPPDTSRITITMTRTAATPPRP
jgi:hypothetical protein